MHIICTDGNHDMKKYYRVRLYNETCLIESWLKRELREL